MTTTFRARSGLDDIRFYVDPRSLEAPRCDRAEARRSRASGFDQTGNSAGALVDGILSHSTHLVRTTTD